MKNKKLIVIKKDLGKSLIKKIKEYHYIMIVGNQAWDMDTVK